MNKQYSYPLDLSWSTEELASVLSFFNDVETAYEGKVEAKRLLESYKKFKVVVPSKSEEKRLGREFESASGYSFYRAVQLAKEQGKGRFRLENKFVFAKEIVKEAGDYILAHMQEELHIERKSSPTDLVTRLDKEVQNFLVDRIRSHYPEDQFCAEEGCLRASVGYGSVWVIDPIDGTNNFVAQGEDFAIMVAYFENGVGQFGIIYDVMKGHCYHGGGAFQACLNEELLPNFKDKPLRDFLIASNAGMLETNAWGVAELANASLGVRVYGSAAISFSRILSGQLLAYITYLQPWDYAAASILGEGLGYQIITLSGEPVDFESRQPIMMAPREKLAEIQSYIYERKLS